MATLPSWTQEVLNSEIRIALDAISKSGTPQLFEQEAQRQERQRKLVSLMVVYFVNRISLLFNAPSKAGENSLSNV
jgi:hypothetical protein